MYQKCPICKGKGILKKSDPCPTCLGERIIHQDNGLPPSKQFIPYSMPYIPYTPPVYPTYPWEQPPVIYTGGTDSPQILSNIQN